MMGFGRLSCNLQKSGKHLRNGPKLLWKASSSRKSLFVDVRQAPPKSRSTTALDGASRWQSGGEAPISAPVRAWVSCLKSRKRSVSSFETQIKFV